MFKNGLHTDNHPREQPQDTYRDASNLLYDGFGLVQEIGDINAENLPALSAPKGALHMEGEQVLLFMRKGSGAPHSEIGIYDINAQTYTTVFTDDAVSEKLNLGSYVTAEMRVDGQGNRIVYFVDGTNPPRFIDIDNPPVAATYRTEDLTLFPSMRDMPSVDFAEVAEHGGSLKEGAYYFAFAYVNEDGTRTNWFYVSQPIPIVSEPMLSTTEKIEIFSPDGSPKTVEITEDEFYDLFDDDGIPRSVKDKLTEEYHVVKDSGFTTKKIVLSLSNLDTRFSKLRMAVIRNTEVRVLDDLPVQSRIVYMGHEPYVTGTLEEILVDRSFYTKANAIRQFDDVLYLGGLTQRQDIGYQKYANNIKLHLVEDTSLVTNPFNDSANKGYKDLLTHVKYRGFKRGEVYAFYISWVLKDGSETKAYHIPGRAPTTVGAENETDPVANTDAIFSEVSGFTGHKRFHFRTDPDATYGMGYWENADETYPDTDDWDIWDVVAGVGTDLGTDIRNQPVRHHRIPDYRHSKTLNGANPDAATHFRIAGISLTDVKIPDDLKEEVVGYKIYYAERSLSNGQILLQGIGLNPETSSGELKPGRYTNDSIGGSYTEDYKYLVFHNFEIAQLLKDSARDQNLGRIAFLRQLFETDGTAANTANARSDPPDDTHYIKKVVAATHLPTNVVKTPLSGFTIEFGDNTQGLTRLVLELDSAITQTGINFMWDLCVFDPTVYEPFSQQKLIFTGYVHRNLSSLNSANIFGGDTVLVDEVYVPNSFDVPAAGGYQYGNNVKDVYEMRVNPFFQKRGEEVWQVPSKFPAVDSGAPTADIPDDEEWDRWYGYGEPAKATANLKVAFPNSREVQENLNTRIIRSQKAKTYSAENNFRIFLPEDYWDLPGLRGDLVHLATVGETLLAHMERGFFLTRGREELVTGDFRAFLGSGDILSVTPSERIPTPTGFGGLQNPSSTLLTEYGYFWVDYTARKVFLYNGKVEEISAYGMKDYFRNLLVRSGGALKGFGANEPHLGYDPVERRVMLTAHGTTLSFDPSRKVWVSKHSYVPGFYIPSNIKFLTVESDVVHEHHEGTPGAYYGSNVAPSLELSFPGEGVYTLNRLLLDTLVTDGAGTEIEDTFTQVQVQNDFQDTGAVALTKFDPSTGQGHLRRIGRIWLLTGLRSDENPGGTPPLPGWAYKERLRDTYHRVTFHRGHDGNRLRIHGISPNPPQIKRT